jgi:hypothetical protein
MPETITYLSICGMLGYGFPEETLVRVRDEQLAFVGVDGGSTDPGPYYLGSGKGFVKPLQIRRDLELALELARDKQIPLIIGSSGGSGAKPHVDGFVEILLDIAKQRGDAFKLAVIYADLDHSVIKKALVEERISPCGPVPELQLEQIDRIHNPVAQFGVEPIIGALEAGADVIVSGRCCDTAVFASYPIWKGIDPGLAMHCAKIAECGALCAVPVGANDSLLCTISPDSFVVEPVNPDRRCTPESVAAHSLYEQPNPECFFEPEGMVDMRETVFEQYRPRAVKAHGTRLRPPQKKTLKLEGAVLKGYRAVTIAGTCDPMVIAYIDELEAGVRKGVAANLKGVVDEDAYRLIFRRYGLDAATFVKPEPAAAPHEIGLMIEAVAPTQDLADTIVSLARSTALHQPFPGRKATAGNLAFPFSPSDLSGGPVYEFALYHLMEVDDPESMFPVNLYTIGGSNTTS